MNYEEGSTEIKFWREREQEFGIPPALMVALEDTDGVIYVSVAEVQQAIAQGDGAIAALIADLNEGLDDAAEVGF